ncbi:MAG TPA: efflux RND transporter periplasmic adaptor subunit, partial [Kofleriaceae bacterium]|nr:efflux RND transporter periplasmic adaptor subunit [Kofleriaceae bacterium]
APKRVTCPEIGARSGVARAFLVLLGLLPEELDELIRTGQPVRATPLRAPISGHVTRFGAVLGSRADPDTVLYELADLSTVWVVASVPERDLPTLRPGGRARFLLSQLAAPAEPLAARIDLVEPALDEVTRTARVRMVVANPGGRLRPGQFGEVELDGAATTALVVPRDAVIRTGQHEYVYLLVGAGRFEPRSVRTGPARGGLVPIASGLVEGDRVVTSSSTRFLTCPIRRWWCSPSGWAALPRWSKIR